MPETIPGAYAPGYRADVERRLPLLRGDDAGVAAHVLERRADLQLRPFGQERADGRLLRVPDFEQQRRAVAREQRSRKVAARREFLADLRRRLPDAFRLFEED